MDISGLELVPSPPQRFAHKELWVELSSFQVQGECHVFRPPDTANKQGRKPKHTYGPGPRKTHTHTHTTPARTHTHTHTRLPHSHTHALYSRTHTHTHAHTHTYAPPIPALTHAHPLFLHSYTHAPYSLTLQAGKAGKAEEGSGQARGVAQGGPGGRLRAGQHGMAWHAMHLLSCLQPAAHNPQ